MSSRKKKYYAVARGRATGIFTTWFGPGNAHEQIEGFARARYKGFETIEEAREWLRAEQDGAGTEKKPRRRSPKPEQPSENSVDTSDADVVIYTDGGCSGNPGPGGYGAVIRSGEERREISGGFRRTTNNRMELLACIEALRTVPTGAVVVLHSDSRYVVNGISKGWAKKWRAKGWMRTPTAPAENCDMWEIMLDLCEKRTVRFVWVKGHAGNPENERCDELATGAAAGTHLSRDVNFEQGRTTVRA